MNKNYKVLILPLATRDLKEAILWYESNSKDLGKRFLSEIEKKVNYILNNPLASNVRYDEIHTSPVNVFPFLIHYKVDKDNEKILIIAILHTSLDHGKWKSRNI